ncbi:MAG: Glutamyl-tRNA reductase (EC [uncultured Campylobacterales bacterium]|uniref:Glutamyl-tRNA reductase n=1 Tax=uncultured Campylobacterales bacterium TaxID=352960 RepID=A0A6S6SMP3_9BACT|nr:MAG: Glutamyl-tRNA reductase (EC [uncultured Campylobacterales bacterium]
MPYKILSFNHKNNPLEIREKLNFNNENIVDFLSKFRIDGEVVILSTCNRVEFITYNLNTHTLLKNIEKYLSIKLSTLNDLAQTFENTNAIKHFFSVISSLESIVLGETQIVSQIKKSFELSRNHNFTSLHLPRLLQYGLKVSSDVRNQTQISKNSVSISSVAVDFAKDFLDDDIGGFSAVVIGAGSVAKLLIKNLVKNKVNVILVNRTLENAKQISDEMGELVRIVSYDRIPELINRYRIMFSCTSSPSAIIKESMITEVNFNRIWFDLAIPRDIENFKNSKINVLRIDDLKSKSNENYQQKQEQTKYGYKLIEEHLNEFSLWTQSLEIEPLIKNLRLKAKDSSLKEINRFVNKGYISKDYQEELEKLLHASFNNFLHDATKKLKNISTNQKADTIVESIQEVFDI